MSTACHWEYPPVYRKRIVFGLIAAGLPLFASAAAQHPAETATDHPAPSAHANAVAGQASAARIEACMHASDALLTNLEKGDGTAAAARFSALLKTKVQPSQLDQLWAHVTSRAGTLQGRGTPQNAMFQQDVVIVLPLQFARVNLNFQVACNGHDQVDGFFLRPMAPPAGAPPASGS